MFVEGVLVIVPRNNQQAGTRRPNPLLVSLGMLEGFRFLSVHLVVDLIAIDMLAVDLLAVDLLAIDWPVVIGGRVLKICFLHHRARSSHGAVSGSPLRDGKIGYSTCSAMGREAPVPARVPARVPSGRPAFSFTFYFCLSTPPSLPSFTLFIFIQYHQQ